MTTKDPRTARCTVCCEYKPISESRITLDQVRTCYTCQPHAVGDWRVTRQLTRPTSEDVAAGAYQNVGPYVSRREALEARAMKMAAEAIYHLRNRDAIHAGNIFLALTIHYEASRIDVGDLAWTVFQL